jgi:hypothetical protein
MNLFSFQSLEIVCTIHLLFLFFSPGHQQPSVSILVGCNWFQISPRYFHASNWWYQSSSTICHIHMIFFSASRTLVYWYYLILFLMPIQQWLILSPSHPKFLSIFTIHSCKICSLLQPLDLACSQCITFNVQKHAPEIYYAGALKLLVVWSICRSIRDVKVFSCDFNCIYRLWMIKLRELIEEQKLFQVAYCIIKWIQWGILLNFFGTQLVVTNQKPWGECTLHWTNIDITMKFLVSSCVNQCLPL